jgi:hypothetical protein
VVQATLCFNLPELAESTAQKGLVAYNGLQAPLCLTWRSEDYNSLAVKGFNR